MFLHRQSYSPPISHVFHKEQCRRKSCIIGREAQWFRINYMSTGSPPTITPYIASTFDPILGSVWLQLDCVWLVCHLLDIPARWSQDAGARDQGEQPTNYE